MTTEFNITACKNVIKHRKVGALFTAQKQAILNYTPEVLWCIDEYKERQSSQVKRLGVCAPNSFILNASNLPILSSASQCNALTEQTTCCDTCIDVQMEKPSAPGGPLLSLSFRKPVELRKCGEVQIFGNDSNNSKFDS
jgi:hypothetical protein